MAAYDVFLLIVGLAMLGPIVLPRLLEDRPLSFPIVYVTLGALLFTFVPGAPTVDPIESVAVTERLTELVVIISLMGAGLKIDRPFGVRRWAATWRLLGIALPLTAGVMAVLAWGVLGLVPATAILLGAVIAPTDPVLASGVEAGAPLTDAEEAENRQYEWGTIRFSLTSEAGFNDGLAFPLTNLAIVVAAATVEGGTGASLLEWAAVDVVYKIVVGVLVGYLVGRVLARVLFRLPATDSVAEIMEQGEAVMAGAEALAATLIAYGLTELVHGYGFIAVFVGAVALRHFEWTHDYYEDLHDFAVLIERLLMATVLILFGGALAHGLLGALTVPEALLGLALLLVVRPLAGIVSFLGTDASWHERAITAFFGIRGIGSFYYLAHALNESSFREMQLVIAAERLWAFVGFVVLSSIVVHGVTASPVMGWFDEWRRGAGEATPERVAMDDP